MEEPPWESVYPVSLFGTPSVEQQEVFYTVPRAGHVVGGRGHRIEREQIPGHEVMLCVRGCGWVQACGRKRVVKAGEWVWVDGRKAHRYGAMEEDPWEVLWVRMEGPRLNRLSGMLGVEGAAVWEVRRVDEARVVYERIFERMGEEGVGVAAALNADLAQLLALVFEARQTQGAEDLVPMVLRKPVEQMRLHYFKPLRVSDLAALAGMSTAHFSRLFRASFGTSPIDWLRRERINQAKRRLVEGDAQIQEVAGQVGYGDRFFFSKDFRRLVGMTPKEYRERERISGV